MPNSEPDILEMCERYERLYSASVYDVLDEMGLGSQCLSLDIRPLQPAWVVAGDAFTLKWTAESRHPVDVIRGRPGSPNIFGIVDQFYAGCVLVMETGKSMNVGHWGELTGLMSQVRGCRGAVIDGGVRDSRQLRERGDYPVFARYTSPIESVTRAIIVDVQCPLLMSGSLTEGLLVRPADFIFGDADGVLVIPREIALEVLVKAEEVAEKENMVREEIRAGEHPLKVWQKYGRF
jgi:regulator of RNase E activity RraA